jgi:hypothetical protein
MRFNRLDKQEQNDKYLVTAGNTVIMCYSKAQLEETEAKLKAKGCSYEVVKRS